MNIHENKEQKNLFAIRDIYDGAIHSSRYYCLDDAASAIDEIAYEHEIDK